jgi:3-isopropylmalate/(R)-2-methylmalate dehydratase small subunit
MNPVEKITSRVVPLIVDDIDTDQIIPARFLKTTEKVGLGQHLFADWRVRFRPDAEAHILLAGANFGCGSSREHAVWALTDGGFAAVVAPSFADIFRANALKNGLVPVAVEPPLHAFLRDALAGNVDMVLTVDVRQGELTLPDGERVAFPLEPFARRCLVEGIDELAYIQKHEALIAAYEARHV